MKVKVRHIEEGRAVDFTQCSFQELPELIQFVEESGGFYCSDQHHPFHSYQLVLEDGAAYAEILVGTEPPQS